MSYQMGLSMDEKVTSLFQPDTLLPDQFLDTYRRKFHLEPEKKLMLAVLEDAIACYQKYVSATDAKGRALFQETEQWILDDNNDWLFSFANVSDTLGFDPEYLRAGLLRWKTEELESRAKARIYQLAPRHGKRKGPVTAKRKPGHKMRKAATR